MFTDQAIDADLLKSQPKRSIKYIFVVLTSGSILIYRNVDVEVLIVIWMVNIDDTLAVRWLNKSVNNCRVIWKNRCWRRYNMLIKRYCRILSSIKLFSVVHLIVQHDEGLHQHFPVQHRTRPNYAQKVPEDPRSCFLNFCVEQSATILKEIGGYSSCGVGVAIVIAHRTKMWLVMML